MCQKSQTDIKYLPAALKTYAIKCQTDKNKCECFHRRWRFISDYTSLTFRLRIMSEMAFPRHLSAAMPMQMLENISFA